MTTIELEPVTTGLDEGTRRVLAVAKGLVAAGWCQGAYKDGDRYCVLGALHAAMSSCDARLPVVSALRATGIVKTMGFDTWNDAPGRTQAEVVALFDKALGA